MTNKKFLITGGAGFIGTNLAINLVKEGHQVVVVDNLAAGDHRDRLPEEVNFHKIDIRDTEKLAEAMDGIEVVVHLAALPRVQFSIEHPRDTHDVNVTGTLSVLEAARSKGVRRIVYAASSSAYGDQETLPLSLDLPVQPKSPYALQKYMGEELMRLWSQIYGLETVSLRFFNVYGPHMDPDGAYALVIGRFMKLRLAGEPLTVTGDGEQTRDFTHVSDVARAIMHAGLVDGIGQGETFNVGAGGQTSINEIAKLIGGEIEYVPARLEPKHTMADVSKTREYLNWEPKIAVSDGIAELKKEAGL
jgi:UDP-glucose 4-epimerase